MTDTITGKYQIGDDVTFVVEGNRWPGKISGPSSNRFCTSCHCFPPDPDHEHDGSACCPGPWYEVEHRCPCGCDALNKVSFAEHELTPPLPSQEETLW